MKKEQEIEYRYYQTVYESPSNPFIVVEVLMEDLNGYRGIETFYPRAVYYDAYYKAYDIVAKIEYSMPSREDIYKQSKYQKGFRIIEIYQNNLLPYTWRFDD